MSKREFYMSIQCTAPSGEVGTFIRDDDGDPVSPVFDGLYQLYPWMRENGWQDDEYEGNQFKPLRVSQKQN